MCPFHHLAHYTFDKPQHFNQLISFIHLPIWSFWSKLYSNYLSCINPIGGILFSVNIPAAYYNIWPADIHLIAMETNGLRQLLHEHAWHRTTSIAVRSWTWFWILTPSFFLLKKICMSIIIWVNERFIMIITWGKIARINLPPKELIISHIQILS